MVNTARKTKFKKEVNMFGIIFWTTVGWVLRSNLDKIKEWIGKFLVEID